MESALDGGGVIPPYNYGNVNAFFEFTKDSVIVTPPGINDYGLPAEHMYEYTSCLYTWKKIRNNYGDEFKKIDSLYVLQDIDYLDPSTQKEYFYYLIPTAIKNDTLFLIKGNGILTLIKHKK